MKMPILLVGFLLILIACSTEGDLKVINRTAHNLYFSVKGNDYVLEGATEEEIDENIGPSKTVSFNTGKQFLFWGGDKKKVDLEIEGETFLLPDNNTTTEVKIESGSTTKVFTDPTHAGVKVINESGYDIVWLYCFTDFDPTLRVLSDNIPDGTQFYDQLAPSSSETQLYYTFKIVLDNFEEYYYGGLMDENANLGIDDQYLIHMIGAR